MSTLPRIRSCGRNVRSTADGVELRSTDGEAGWHGLQHCGSVWSCSVCSARILFTRSLEIGAALGGALAQGYKLAFVTLTERHSRQQSLASLWDAAGVAWAKVTKGRSWELAQARYGVVGWVRVWEVTTGVNGWHVHAHVVLVLDESTTSADLDALGSSMFGRWSRSLVRSGLRAPLRKGQDWHLVGGADASAELGKYLTKMQDDRGSAMGLELAYSQPGRSRSALKTRPVWSLLDDLRETGEVGRWREWETTSKGRRQIGWSKGLRERFGVLDEQSDEEIARSEIGSESDAVACLTSDAWGRLVAEPGRPLLVLQTVRAAGVAAGLSLLTEWGIAWTEPAQPPVTVRPVRPQGTESRGRTGRPVPEALRLEPGMPSAAGAQRPEARGRPT